MSTNIIPRLLIKDLMDEGLGAATGKTVADNDGGIYARKNMQIRESVDNLDLDEEFKPPVEQTIDQNATIGLGATAIMKPQMIAGGGVNDITQDPNNTIDALLGGMQPKNNLASSKEKV